MIGLCSLGKALRPEVTLHVGSAGLRQALQSEADAVEDLFRQLRITTTAVRREIRRRLEKGESERIPPTLEASQDVNEISQRAALLARRSAQETVTSLHFLAAVLTDLRGDTAVAVHSAGADPSRISNDVADWVNQGGLAKHCDSQPAGVHNSPGMNWLATYGRDLTQEARDGKLSPVIGRREELLKLIRTLGRRTKNNPVLLGEPGVGKTAIVNGLALRIAAGKVLPGSTLVELNPARLVAGTKFRGEFEERLTQTIEEARTNPNIILFFDEIHVLIGAGAAEGSLDAANILKPHLANGDIRCIGATTVADYRRIVERDSALERRLQPIIVTEPTPERSREILAGLKSVLETHHSVEIEPDAFDAAVELAVRYVHDRQLPDKALDALDEACSYVRIPDLYMHAGNSMGLRARRPVTKEDVAEVISTWTGIPVGRLTTSDADRLLRMEEFLRGHLVGQDEAVIRVASRIRKARSGLADGRRPLGVFLFVGPSGVGKTELAKLLAEALFDAQDEIIRIDMTEFQEKHSVSKLIGAPPGYVGHEEEGLLTRRLRVKPFSVVLLDEVDKAHHDVLNVFLPMFDEGHLTDAKGRTVVCRHAVYIMTANRSVARRRPGFDLHDNASDAAGTVLSELRQSFSVEFLNRVDEIIVFKHLQEGDIREIARRRLESLRQRALKTHEIALQFAENIIDLLVRLGYHDETGARQISHVVERVLEEPLADQILSGKLRQRDRVVIQASGDQVRFETVTVTQ